MPKKKVGQSTKRHARGAARAETRRHFGREKEGAPFRAAMQRSVPESGNVGWAGIRYSKDAKKLPKNVWRTAGRKKKKATSGENKPKRTGIK
jgi:hypothetical protein